MVLRLIMGLCLIAVSARAEDKAPEKPILQDANGDGLVSFVGFGDSLTYGVGDGVPAQGQSEELPRTDGSGGYLARLRAWLNIPVINEGVPGERIAEGGVERIPAAVMSRRGDVVGIMEGANDAIVRMGQGEYRRILQRMVNVTRALGSEPLLITTPLPGGGSEGKRPYIASYNSELKNVAALNDIRIADAERAWLSSCASAVRCPYFVYPDGLHPNAEGYDLLAQVVAAALLDINVFAAAGPAQLEQALGLPAGTVLVMPDEQTEVGQ